MALWWPHLMHHYVSTWGTTGTLCWSSTRLLLLTLGLRFACFLLVMASLSAVGSNEGVLTKIKNTLFIFLIFHPSFFFFCILPFVFAIWKYRVRLKTSYHIINGPDWKLLSHNIIILVSLGDIVKWSIYTSKFQMQNKIKLLRLMRNRCCLCS